MQAGASVQVYNLLQSPRRSRAFILHPRPPGARGVCLDLGTVLAHERRRSCARLGREKLQHALLGCERLARALLGHPRLAGRLRGASVVVVLGFGVWGSGCGIQD